MAYSLVEECDKNEIIHNKTLSSSNPCKPYVALVALLFIFMLIHAQKENYKLIITNVNENNKTNKYKKPSKLFF